MNPTNAKLGILPYPDPSMGKQVPERPGEEAFSRRAAHYRPKDANEVAAATVARTAQSLVTARGEGKTYEDVAAEIAAAVEGSSGSAAPEDGHAYVKVDGSWERQCLTGVDPATINYVAPDPAAATASAATYTGAGAAGSLLLTMQTAGAITGTLDLVNPGTANAELSVVNDAENDKVTVNLATDAGAKATSTIPASGDDMVMRVKTAGASGNDVTIDVALHTTASGLVLNGNNVVFPTPSRAALECVLDGDVYTVHPITDAGTPGVLTLTESLPEYGGEITITQKAAYAGSWGNNKIHALINYGQGTSLPLEVSIVYGDELTITITLGTTSEGLPLAVTELDLVTAINDALFVVFGDVLVAGGNGETGEFGTDQAQVSMTGGVDAAIDTTPVAVADFELLLTGVASSDLEVATVGTGNWVPAIATHTFSGGASTPSIATNLTQLKEALAANPILRGSTISNGNTLCEDTAISLTGGKDIGEDTPENIGQIGWPGRDAIDTSDNPWKCVKASSDGTTANAWVNLAEV